jgi:hypothetical protein
MMNTYQLSLSDIKIKEEACEIADINTHLKDGGPFLWICNSIAYFTDTKVWSMSNVGPLRNMHVKFFGLKTDTTVAAYVFEICQRAMVYAWEDYRLSVPGYTQLPGSRKNALKNGFYIGITSRIAARLRAMKDAQRASNLESTGRDLVFVKSGRVEEEYVKLGLELKEGRGGSKSNVDFHAFASGQKAGDGIGLNAGVGQSTKRPIQ